MSDLLHPEQNRREDYRLGISVPVTLTYVDKKAKKNRRISARTLDVSAFGVSLLVKEELPEDTHFVVSFHVQDLMTVPQARIVLAAGKRNGKFVYHCKFENLSSEDESRMRSFVFRRQALIRMKDKESYSPDEADSTRS